MFTKYRLHAKRKRLAGLQARVALIKGYMERSKDAPPAYVMNQVQDLTQEIAELVFETESMKAAS